MLPIVLASKSVKVGLAGSGEGLVRRRAMLAEAGVEPVPTAPEADLDGLDVLFVAGVDGQVSAALAGRARAAGILVNVEDRPDLCDFHVPAMLRRGELLLTVSTGARAPGLARRLKDWLAGLIGPDWSAHLDTIGDARAEWRAQGLGPTEVSRRTREMVAEKGWLA